MNIVREFELQFWSEFENYERIILSAIDYNFHMWILERMDGYIKSGKSIDESKQLTFQDIVDNYANQQTIRKFLSAFSDIQTRLDGRLGEVLGSNI